MSINAFRIASSSDIRGEVKGSGSRRTSLRIWWKQENDKCSFSRFRFLLDHPTINPVTMAVTTVEIDPSNSTNQIDRCLKVRPLIDEKTTNNLRFWKVFKTFFSIGKNEEKNKWRHSKALHCSRMLLPRYERRWKKWFFFLRSLRLIDRRGFSPTRERERARPPIKQNDVVL